MAAPSPIAILIAQGARSRGLDPAAVLAVASQEGLSGRIGDGGHAYGPFQLNNAGGVITGSHPAVNDQATQAWASSPAGINFALDRIAGVAHGLHGQQAINAIVSRFERPRNPGDEIQGALGQYGQYQGLGGGQLAPAVPPVRPTAQAPGVPAPLLRQQLDPATLGILNQGASMFGLPPIPSSAPLRLPTPVAPPGSSPPAGPSTTGHIAPVAPNFKFGRVDQGVDVSQNSPYVSPGSGTVVRIGQVAGGTNLGVYVKLDHPVTVNGRTYPGIYVWHTSPLVKPGQRVSAGQPIMSGGSAEVGFATQDGSPVAPLIGGLGAGTQPTTTGQDMLAFFKHARR